MTQSIPEGFHIVEQPLAIPEGFRVVEPEKPRSEQNFFERFGEDLNTDLASRARKSSMPRWPRIKILRLRRFSLPARWGLEP